MTSIKGLDPIPRAWDDRIPSDERPYLEDIRRASNAVRVLRRRGRPHASAQFRLEAALAAYKAMQEQKDHDHMNPGLF